MAEIEEVLRWRLNTYSGTSALLSGRIYPMQLPQGTASASATYQKISGPRDHTHQGPTGLASPRYQITAWSKQYSEAKAVAKQVRLALDGWFGSALGHVVSAVQLENEYDIYNPETLVEFYSVPVDFIVWHHEETT